MLGQEDAEERQDKPSSGRDSSTGDTSSGSDSSSDSSTSSISDSENSNDLNEENPFHTAPSTAVNKGQNSHFDLRPSPVEETGERRVLYSFLCFSFISTS